MGRLIDEDKLKEQIRGKGLDGACEYNCIDDALDIIDEQPNAINEILVKIDEKITECQDEALEYDKKEWHEESRISYNKSRVWQEVRRLVITNYTTKG